MKVNILPLPITAVPHARLFRLHRLWHATAVHVLCESDVCNARCIIAHQMHVRVQDDSVDWFVAFGQS